MSEVCAIIFGVFLGMGILGLFALGFVVTMLRAFCGIPPDAQGLQRIGAAMAGLAFVLGILVGHA